MFRNEHLKFMLLPLNFAHDCTHLIRIAADILKLIVKSIIKCIHYSIEL